MYDTGDDSDDEDSQFELFQGYMGGYRFQAADGEEWQPTDNPKDARFDKLQWRREYVCFF